MNKRQKTYISGKISGLNFQEYRDRFLLAEVKLLAAGHKVINPVNIGMLLPIDTSWHEYMRADIIQLMSCDTIYMLSNWKDSEGARIEKELAENMGYDIMYEN